MTGGSCGPRKAVPVACDTGVRPLAPTSAAQACGVALATGGVPFSSNTSASLRQSCGIAADHLAHAPGRPARVAAGRNPVEAPDMVETAVQLAMGTTWLRAMPDAVTEGSRFRKSGRTCFT